MYPGGIQITDLPNSAVRPSDLDFTENPLLSQTETSDRFIGAEITVCNLDVPSKRPITDSPRDHGTQGRGTRIVKHSDSAPLTAGRHVHLEVGRRVSIGYHHVHATISIKISEGGAATGMQKAVAPGVLRLQLGISPL